MIFLTPTIYPEFVAIFWLSYFFGISPLTLILLLFLKWCNDDDIQNEG